MDHQPLHIVQRRSMAVNGDRVRSYFDFAMGVSRSMRLPS
jgi:hypothetical protein